MDTLSDQAARDLLKRSWVGSLGLARAGDAHVIPVTYAYDGEHVYLQPRAQLDAELTEGTERAGLLELEEVQGFQQLPPQSKADDGMDIV